MTTKSDASPITKVNEDSINQFDATKAKSVSNDIQVFDPESDPSSNPEIFIGLVSPVGTDLQDVIKSLKKSFQDFDYDLIHIKISKLFEEISQEVKYTHLNNIKLKDRIKEYILFGNELRRNYSKDFLAKISISSIARKRMSNQETREQRKFIYSKTVYIIDQLKTKEEISLLKDIYGEAFFQMSVYSARDIRVDHLSKKQAEADNKRDSNAYRHYAEKLVNRDENERKDYGQKVGKIFQLADVVINVDKANDQPVSSQVDRFVKLLFGHNAYSPNRLEYGMYLAHSAALRSLDLSRQVGAAIFRKTGEIATLGANEVPKAGGGTYWCEDLYDAREYVIARDSNDIRKKELLSEVVNILHPSGVLSPELKAALDETQFMDALEYGRIVHAEMSALSDAARLGIGVQDGTLYCTTFPCHMCSKHIVASGLATVVFLEPYPKSLTSDLHTDSVKIEGASRGKFSSHPSVRFIPFYGITPTRYREFFHRVKRKDKGHFVEYSNKTPRPMFAPIIQPFYVDKENWAITKVGEHLAEPIKVDVVARAEDE